MKVPDVELAGHVRADRVASGADARDEVWEGVYVVSPLADMEHQRISGRLTTILMQLVEWTGQGQVFAGCNVSDRAEGWTENYRVPDVAVFLKGGAGKLHDTHTEGGPDFLVEVLSDDDPAPEKLPFYARNGVREALFVRRDPWALELYRNEAGTLRLAEASTLERPETVTCRMVPITLRLLLAQEGSRPGIEVAEIGGGLRRTI